MLQSFVLSHLPLRFSHCVALLELKKETAPPSNAQIAKALHTSGISAHQSWQLVNLAYQAAEITMRDLQQYKIFAVDYWSEHYPSRLKDLADPPWVLFYRGELPTAAPSLAIVGSRKPNLYGKSVLEEFIPRFDRRPLQIISGLAYGIDALAHHFACESQIPNYAVLACGLDTIYPTAHIELAGRILARGGGIVSEYPPGTAAFRSHFPRRNRIISGLADVVWVVQGTVKSGSLHTAVHALEQGRRIIIVPGDVFDPLSEIPHRLLQDGAQPIFNPSDVDLIWGST